MKILATDGETAFWNIKGQVFRCPINTEEDAKGLPTIKILECSLETWNNLRHTRFGEFVDACEKFAADSSFGKNAGQCVNCGEQWFIHANMVLPVPCREGVNEIRVFRRNFQKNIN
jgi:hypothetical protein